MVLHRGERQCVFEAQRVRGRDVDEGLGGERAEGLRERERERGQLPLLQREWAAAPRLCEAGKGTSFRAAAAAAAAADTTTPTDEEWIWLPYFSLVDLSE